MRSIINITHALQSAISETKLKHEIPDKADSGHIACRNVVMDPLPRVAVLKILVSVVLSVPAALSKDYSRHAMPGVKSEGSK